VSEDPRQIGGGLRVRAEVGSPTPVPGPSPVVPGRCAGQPPRWARDRPFTRGSGPRTRPLPPGPILPRRVLICRWHFRF